MNTPSELATITVSLTLIPCLVASKPEVSSISASIVNCDVAAVPGLAPPAAETATVAEAPAEPPAEETVTADVEEPAVEEEPKVELPADPNLANAPSSQIIAQTKKPITLTELERSPIFSLLRNRGIA